MLFFSTLLILCALPLLVLCVEDYYKVCRAICPTIAYPPSYNPSLEHGC